ncbi:hypothetical protein EVAR_77669_1 [Eumeta japonica]|uniref:Uncharacterized protein n=1 Tax=Eumeta variegata TaxID=151549 RepID=A0A4C2ABZ2_EUMVA|nr:hypothetical protein EVAR_77669_1 [Eumeta japonica]
MVRTRNKIVLLFTWTEDTPFIQATASEKHKIVMYEDRGENLSFLHKYDPACSTTPIDSWGHPVKDPEEMSGSERLRKQIQAEKETKTAKRKS